MLMLLDTSINMAMQPFKMMVGDIVNEEQKAKAYSIQSLLCNAGSFVGFLFPYFFTWIGISNVAPEGVIPDSVIYSFYVGAAILILCVLYTTLKVKEMPPKEYAEFHGIDPKQTENGPKPSMLQLLKDAPSTFWTVGLVQFFCWAAFLYMWTYTNGAIADTVKYSFYIGAAILILCVLFTSLKVKEMPPKEYAEFHGIDLAKQEDGGKGPGMLQLLKKAPSTFWTVGLVQFFCWAAFLYMWTYTNAAIADNVWGTTDTASEAYQIAGNWVGVLFAVQAIGSVLWAMVLPLFRNIKVAYSLSLLLGAVGFISTFFIHDQYLLFISFILIGCGWAAMLAMPFAMLTNSLSGGSMGAYLGLFNCTICLPQIIAALLGGVILSALGSSQTLMLVVAGVAMLLGAVAVFGIKEKTK
jgi:maltose/moltooligosaccharide transporter